MISYSRLAVAITFIFLFQLDATKIFFLCLKNHLMKNMDIHRKWYKTDLFLHSGHLDLTVCEYISGR